jgi:hypothetical protein
VRPRGDELGPPTTLKPRPHRRLSRSPAWATLQASGGILSGIQRIRPLSDLPDPKPPIQNNSGLPQGLAGAFCGRLMQSTDRLQEESVMTWSDSHWVLLYSVLITLFILLWAYVPA